MLDPCLDRLPKLQSGRVAAPSSHGTWEHLNIGHGGTEHAMGLKVRFKPQKSQEILLQDIPNQKCSLNLPEPVRKFSEAVFASRHSNILSVMWQLHCDSKMVSPPNHYLWISSGSQSLYMWVLVLVSGSGSHLRSGNP